MSHHIVEVKQLRHVYPDGTEALRDVSFRIHHGESVAIVGANGAGKSTLLLTSTATCSPTAGTVRIGDHPLTKETLAEIRRTVGMVFQDPDDQLFMPTVYDDVAFGPLNLGSPPTRSNSASARPWTRVEALDLRDKPPYQLSGGEKKRVAIATVLSMLPDILVIDEPTTGLDPRARRQLMALLRDFHHTRSSPPTTSTWSSSSAQRTIVLHEGTVMADGPTLEIFRNEALLAACHLEKPFAMQGCPVCSPATPAVLAAEPAPAGRPARRQPSRPLPLIY